MPRFIFLYFFCFFFGALSVQAQNFLWAKSVGGKDTDFAIGIAVDPAGNSYVTGQIQGTVTFVNQVTGVTTTLVSSGGNDIFVAKYDPSGNVLWATRGGGTSNDDVRGITIDKDGNCYIVGGFRSSAQFGSTTITAVDISDSADMFFIKLDANGNFVWAKNAASGPYNQGGYGVFVDEAGYSYVAGQTQDDVTFGSIELPGRDLDSFIAKFDPAGNPVWAKVAGSVGDDYARDIVVDSQGNSYLTGAFQYTMDFEGVQLTSAGGASDAFIAKYDPDGQIIWARRAGGSGEDVGRNVALDVNGNVYYTGGFENTADFEGPTLSSSGSTDIYMARYSPSGNLTWTQNAGGIGGEYGHSITLDAGGYIFIAGFYGSAAASFGCSNISNNGFNDVYVAKYDPTGANVWTRTVGSASNDAAFGIGVDGAGNAYIAGQIEGQVTFDSETLFSNGQRDIFVAKLFSAPASIALAPIDPVCPGSPVSLTFSASCTIPAGEGYSIQISEVNSTTFSATPNVIGSGTSSPIPITAPANPGTYQVRIVSASGIFSNVVALQVQYKPSSVSLAVNHTEPCAGSFVFFTATPQSGGTSPTYKWTVDGVEVIQEPTQDYIKVPLPFSTVAYPYTVSVEMTSSNLCTGTASATKTIEVTRLPFLGLSSLEGSFCPNDLLSLTFGADCFEANTTYTAQLSKLNSTTFPAIPTILGSGTSSPLALTLPPDIKPGYYQIRLVSSNGVVSDLVELDVMSTQSSVALKVSETDPCGGTSITFTATPNNGGLSPTYQWTVNGVTQEPTGATLTVSLPTAGPTYTLDVKVTMTSSNSCTSPVSDQKIIPITKFPGITLTNVGNPFCPQSPLSLFFTTQCVNETGISYTAQVSEVNTSTFGANALILGNTFSHDPSQPFTTVLPTELVPGAYKVRIVSSSGLYSNVIDLVITNTAIPNLSLQMDRSEECTGNGVIVKTVYTGNGDHLLFQWKVNGVNQGNPTREPFFNLAPFSPQQATLSLQVGVEIRSSLPCTSPVSAQLPLTLYPLPQITCAFSDTIDAANKTVFTASATSGQPPYHFDWDFGTPSGGISTTNDSVFYSYASPGVYYVKAQVRDARGCQATCEKMITVVSPLNLPPNVFTPNGDAYNERFTIDYRGNEPFEMLIYNRWGRPVATIHDGLNGWDGAGSSTGIYFYLIKVAGKELKGWVSLLR